MRDALRWLLHPWRTLSGRLVVAATAGLVMATLIFVAVTVGLIRSHTLRVELDTLDRQTDAMAKQIGASWQRAAETGDDNACVNPQRTLEAVAGPSVRIGQLGLNTFFCPPIRGSVPPELVAQLSPSVIEEQGVQHANANLAQFGGRNYIASARPLLVNGRAFGSLVIYRPYAEFATAWKEIVPRVLLAGLLGLLLALALMLLLSRRITRPLRLLSRASERVAEGDHDVRLGKSGTVEIDRMANAFNRMVDKLGERDRLSRDFLMRITHDLRTPLTSIRGHAAALSDGIVPPDQVARSLEAIESEADRLGRMVSDLLDLAKMEADQMRIESAAADLAEVVGLSCEAFEPAASDLGISIQRDLPATCPVHTDAARVGQILANLLDNALRWTPQGGVVTVSLIPARAPEPNFIIIRDTGPGVPLAAREAVFDPFHSVRTPDGEYGSGLGLATGRLLARALGGDLVVSEASGGGAVFRLTIPQGVGDRKPGPVVPQVRTA